MIQYHLTLQRHNRLWNNYVPALAWLVLSSYLIFWGGMFKFDPIGIFIVLRASVIVGCLLIREFPTREAPFYQRVFAWVSTLMPLALRWESNHELVDTAGTVISILGSCLATWAIIDLGKSFGISPALRSHVNKGVYRYLNQPIYIGYIIASVGILLVTPSMYNLIITVVSWILLFIRSQWEKVFLSYENKEYIP